MIYTILTVIASLYLARYYITLINKTEKLENKLRDISDLAVCEETGLVGRVNDMQKVVVSRFDGMHYGEKTDLFYSNLHCKPYDRIHVHGNRTVYLADNVEVTESGKPVKIK